MIKIDTSKESHWRKVYGVFLIAATIMILLLIGGELFALIDIDNPPYDWIINTMIFFFTVDYLWRLKRAKKNGSSLKIIFMI
ncbi:hypothetical protein [Lactococcus sp.]|uniref:hypothetical protein n=1 Tax=Lactococcus sp. TaxID=44273 RepID=UPI002FCBE65F